MPNSRKHEYIRQMKYGKVGYDAKIDEIAISNQVWRYKNSWLLYDFLKKDLNWIARCQMSRLTRLLMNKVKSYS